MAAKYIAAINIRSEKIFEKMAEKSMSIRELARTISATSEKSLRRYFENEKIPSTILGQICDVLNEPPSTFVKERTIQMFIGATIPVTDEELHSLCRKSLKKSRFGYYYFEDIDFEGGERVRQFFERAIPDGESYIPGYSLEEYEHFYQDHKRGERD